MFLTLHKACDIFYCMLCDMLEFIHNVNKIVILMSVILRGCLPPVKILYWIKYMSSPSAVDLWPTRVRDRILACHSKHFGEAEELATRCSWCTWDLCITVAYSMHKLDPASATLASKLWMSYPRLLFISTALPRHMLNKISPLIRRAMPGENVESDKFRGL
jgi:hypothetical protein